MNTVKIYTLADPKTFEIKYIGKTIKTLNRRLSTHIQDSKKYNHKCANWIKSLKCKPIIELIEEVDILISNDVEIYWIAQFKAWGFNLKNGTSGGDGASIGLKRSEEAKKKTSETLKRKYASGEIKMDNIRKQKISNSHKGKKVSLETKEKLRLINLNKKATEQSKIKKQKQVYKYDLEGNFIKMYNSLKEAAKDIKGVPGNISNAVYGYNRMKTYKGFIWKYDKI